jgi:hypothetical protein
VYDFHGLAQTVGALRRIERFGVNDGQPSLAPLPDGLVTLAGAHCCSAVSKRDETDKHLYLP